MLYVFYIFIFSLMCIRKVQELFSYSCYSFLVKFILTILCNFVISKDSPFNFLSVFAVTQGNHWRYIHQPLIKLLNFSIIQFFWVLYIEKSHNLQVMVILHPSFQHLLFGLYFQFFHCIVRTLRTCSVIGQRVSILVLFRTLMETLLPQELEMVVLYYVQEISFYSGSIGFFSAIDVEFYKMHFEHLLIFLSLNY